MRFGDYDLTFETNRKETESFEFACIRLCCFCTNSCTFVVCSTCKKPFVVDTVLSNHIMAAEPEMKQHDELIGVTNTPVLGAGINGATSYAHIPETKTFYPTLDEFASPLVYIQSIRDEAMKYGIIKIKPPPGTVCRYIFSIKVSKSSLLLNAKILAPLYDSFYKFQIPNDFTLFT